VKNVIDTSIGGVAEWHLRLDGSPPVEKHADILVHHYFKPCVSLPLNEFDCFSEALAFFGHMEPQGRRHPRPPSAGDVAVVTGFARKGGPRLTWTFLLMESDMPWKRVAGICGSRHTKNLVGDRKDIVWWSCHPETVFRKFNEQDGS
jgi:hypothetical protein